MIKRISSFCLAAFLVFTFSISSFAISIDSLSSEDIYTSNLDGSTLRSLRKFLVPDYLPPTGMIALGVLDFSKLTTEQISFFELFRDVLLTSGNHPTYIPAISQNGSFLEFHLMERDSLKFNNVANGSETYKRINYKGLKVYGNKLPNYTNWFTPTAPSDLYLNCDYTLSVNYSILLYDSAIVQFLYDNNHLSKIVNNDIFISFMPTNAIQIFDSLGIFGTFDPEPPTEPEPEPPIVVPPAPDIPVIGAVDNEYITYDTTKWNDFLEYVLGHIGSATTIGMRAFAIIFGILICIKVVKMFVRV